MTPKPPSEPSISWRRSGPAAFAGELPRVSSPRGVATREADDQRVEAAVAGARLPAGAGGGEAADGGELERLWVVAQRQPLLGEQRLGLGTAQARLEGARSSTPCRRPSSRFIRIRSRLSRPAYPSRRAARPPVTEVPPPKGTTARWCSTAKARTAATSSWPSGRTTASGASERSPGAGLEQVGRRLAAGAQAAGRVIGQHVLGTQQVAQRGEQRRVQPRGRQLDLLGGGALLHAEGQLDQASCALRQWGRGGRVAPALGVHLDGRALVNHVLHCDT